MPKYFLLILTASLFSTIIHAQTCDCKSNYEWVKATFEKNDAGFQYIIDQKGKEAYEDHNRTFLAKITAEKDKSKCLSLIYEWMTFFRHGHIAIRPLGNNSGNTTAQAPAPDASQFANWETVNEDLQEFEKYLRDKKAPDFEGVWQSPPYTIGIKRYGSEYKGFIIESGANTWTKGQIKLRITGEGSAIHSTFYMRDHSAQESNVATLIGKNHLQLGNFSLIRQNSPWQDDKDVQLYFRAAAAQKPFIEQLNKTTLFLRIPSFLPESKKDIDSVIAANMKKITSTDHLVVDITNGTGGSDISFASLIPIIYTNPIRTVGVEYYSTPLNNQRMLDFINKPEYLFDDERKKWAKTSYDTLSLHLGQFVSLSNPAVEIESFDKVYPYPKHVAIIINEYNGSTDEQFLLAAKQSSKVKLFGATTMGSLDISNMYFIPSPCNEFELGYCLSRSMRIPGMTIDGKGIQPDYYIDKTIPRYKWIEFVSDALNAR